jgi:hypothetical protein
LIPVPVATSSVSVSDAHAGGTTNLHHIQLMSLLKIDSELSDRTKKGLRWCYKKYKAFNVAVQFMDQLSKEGKWPLAAKKPSHTELVEIFMSKSYWHSHVVKPFAVLACHPQMVTWLEDEEDDLSDFDVWHLQKSEYGFKELKEWLKNAVLYTPPRSPSGLRGQSELSEDCPRTVRRQSEDSPSSPS